MNNKILIGMIIGVVVIVAAGIIVNSSMQDEVDNPGKEIEDQMSLDMMEQKNNAMEKDGNSENGEAMTKPDDSSTEGEKMMQGDAMVEPADKDVMSKDQPGSYKTYSESTVAAEQAKGNKVVLFFHASWCPTCRSADKAFNENIDRIPAGVTLLKTDYDTNDALKQKYGVTYQHTYVQIDNNGDRVTTWVSGDIDKLISSVQ